MPHSILSTPVTVVQFSEDGMGRGITDSEIIISSSSRNNPLENGIQLESMPYSILNTHVVVGASFSENGMGMALMGYDRIISISKNNNPRSYKKTCREENTLADYDYHNDDTDPSGVGMLVIGDSSNLVDPIEG